MANNYPCMALGFDPRTVAASAIQHGLLSLPMAVARSGVSAERRKPGRSQRPPKLSGPALAAYHIEATRKHRAKLRAMGLTTRGTIRRSRNHPELHGLGISRAQYSKLWRQKVKASQ